MIEEVPIQADAPVEDAPEEPFTVVAKKKRGRPPGALNKAKAVIQEVPIPEKQEKQPKKQKPKPPPPTPGPSESEEEAPAPKRQKKKQARPRVADSDSEEEPARRKPRPALAAPDAHQLAAQVLQLLSTRHVGQANARREKYASWFAQ